MTADQILRVLDIEGGTACEDEITASVGPSNPASPRSRTAEVLDCLRTLEISGLVEAKHTMAYTITPAGRLRLASRRPKQAECEECASPVGEHHRLGCSHRRCVGAVENVVEAGTG